MDDQKVFPSKGFGFDVNHNLIYGPSFFYGGLTISEREAMNTKNSCHCSCRDRDNDHLIISGRLTYKHALTYKRLIGKERTGSFTIKEVEVYQVNL